MIEIKHRITGAVLYRSETAATVRGAIEQAVASCANLRDANLSGADLRDADLRGADLRDADLRGANLSGAYLRGANLRDANLRGANLSDARGIRLPGMPDPAELRLRVAAHIEAHPDLHDQGDWGDGSADPECKTPCCVAGWTCHLGGGHYGLSVPTAAAILLTVDGKPMPDFSADASRDEILQALRA